MKNAEALNMVTEFLAVHYSPEHISEGAEGVIYVGNATHWAKVEILPNFAGQYDGSFTITKGYEAGVHLNGDIEFKEVTQNVRGAKFGVIPKVLQWVKP